MLRTALSETDLGEHLSLEETAETIVKSCQWCLSGHQRAVDEMRDPEKSWSSQLFMGEIGVSVHLVSTIQVTHDSAGAGEQIYSLCS